jgi:hypothetical protein
MDPAENRIRRIVLERLGTCRVCHRQHEDRDVSVVSQKPDVWMMVVECPDCRTRSFVAAVVDEKQVDDASVALRRLAGEHLRPRAGLDLNEIAADVPAETQPVSQEDVDGMHTFLETFNGDFRSLFAKT